MKLRWTCPTSRLIQIREGIGPGNRRPAAGDLKRRGRNRIWIHRFTEGRRDRGPGADPRRGIDRVRIDRLGEGQHDSSIKRYIRRPVHGRDRQRRGDHVTACAGREGTGKRAIEWYAVDTFDALGQRKGIGRRGRQGRGLAERHDGIAKLESKGSGDGCRALREGKGAGRHRRAIDRTGEGHGHGRVARNIDQAHGRRDEANLLRRAGEIGIAVLEDRIAVGIRHHHIGRTRHGGRHLHDHGHRRDERDDRGGFIADLDRRAGHEVRAGEGRLLPALDGADIR